MGKRALILLAPVLVIVAAVSWAATTWQLQTKLNTSGGTIKVRTNATQTTAGSIVYTNFTTSANVPVYVNALNGYAISALTKNGSAVAVGSGTTSYSTYFNKSAGTTQNLIASFAAVQYSVSSSSDGPGSITVSNTSVPYNGSLTITATPTYTSGVVKSLTVNGVPVSGVTFPYPGRLSVTLSNITSNSVIYASFDTVTANAGGNKITSVDEPVTLSGSATGGGTTSWAMTSGPVSVDTSAWVTPTPSFKATVAGTYDFKMNQSVNGTVLASSTTQVTVAQSTTDYVRTKCNGCHANPGGANPSTAFALWSTSGHKNRKVHCITCHTDSAMPTPVNTATVNKNTFMVTGSTAGTVGSYYCVNCHNASIVSDYNTSRHSQSSVGCVECHVQGVHNTDVAVNACDRCHRDAGGNVANHPFAIGVNTCVSCHSPHSTAATVPNTTAAHYNNITSAGYPASYVTSRIDCSDCHRDNSQNAAVRGQWAQSGHAAVKDRAWTVSDFKTMSGCAQCHTTTGFIAYSTGKVKAAWGSASDKTKEVLACSACHSDIATGATRRVAAVQPFADDTYKNRDIGVSNLCMNCHSGTNNGNSIESQVGKADFNNLSFIQPHYLAAGGTMHGKGGYHFQGQTYAFYSSNSHRTIGMGNKNNTGTSGPCVACHMSASQKHLYQAVTTDQNGAITAVTTTACTNCHGSYMDATTLNSKQGAYDNGLDVLKAMLADKGYLYSPVAPYFANKNWGTGQAGADAMGAAFNYQLLIAEPGAYAHNSGYAKKLISDSIDVLYNGSVTGSIDSALGYLVGKGAITQGQADSLTSYTKNGCTACHGGTTSTPTPMSSNAHGAHLTSDYGPGSYLGSDIGSCQTCHVYGGDTHQNGVVNLVNNGCVGCHPAGVPTWGDKTRLTCTSCHAATPSVLPNGVAAPYKASFGTTGHGQFAASNQCVNCHDANSRHISGGLGNYNRLSLNNDNNLCASCHNDPGKVSGNALNVVTHKTLTCLTCHDPHGTANLSMIRGTINGTAITYRDTINGFIDTVTLRGLCQVCHTTTSHYRAGVPETNHYTSGCLSCHTHSAGFKPAGGSCDSCHGYPPAPKSPQVSFGTTGNWVNAKFEDYSGGGGAHLATVHVSPTAKASEGWTNCTMCHNGGRTGSSPYHKMVTPVKTHIENVHIEVDGQYRFAEGFGIYTGAKLVSAPGTNASGSCFNISCHMSPSRRWSTER